LFEQAKLFRKLLFYGIGTMFSLALLSVMVAIALKMVLAVSAAFWVGKFTGASTEGINSMALQQGGLGLILTALIVTALPMAAAFFQGMLGAFTPYTAFSSDGGARASRDGRWGGGNSYPPGHGGNPGGVAPTSSAQGGYERSASAAENYSMSASRASANSVGSSLPQAAVPKKDFKPSEV
jgi:type IV secretion system protein VirB6